MTDDPISALDRKRIARKLWGDEVLDDQGHYYAGSSDEEVAILRERVCELQDHTAVSAVQEIQLDLIRSRRFNQFDGQRVFHDLLCRRSLWVSVLMDRLGDPSGLVKLRDLPFDHWNVDTLYVLARGEDCARELAELSTDWRADSVDVYDAERSARAIGSSPTDGRVVAWWWD